MTHHSILAEQASALPPALRRIARALLDREHLRAASGMLAAEAAQAVTEARMAGVRAVLDPNYLMVDGTSIPGVCTVRDTEGHRRLYQHYRDPQFPAVEVFDEDGRPLGSAHLAVQFPI